MRLVLVLLRLLVVLTSITNPHYYHCMSRRFFATAMSTSTSISRSTNGKNNAASSSSKIVYIVRHGQAVHNVRAEVSKEAGCSFAEFLQLMKDDDALDAPLTPLGIEQAQHCRDQYFQTTTTKKPTQDGAPTKNHNTATTNPLGIDLIVASCLSRTIDTADILFPPLTNNNSTTTISPPRLCLEQFREINGALLNGKRRTKSELREQYQALSPHGPSSGGWNFDSLCTETDESWDPDTLEPTQQSAERGYQGLMDLLVRPTHRISTNTTVRTTSSLPTILLVGHGGMLKYTMTDHPCVQLRDERTTNTSRNTRKSVDARFDNCELRKYRLSWQQDEEEDTNNRATEEDDDTHDDTVSSSTPRVPQRRRRGVVLTQLDH